MTEDQKIAQNLYQSQSDGNGNNNSQQSGGGADIRSLQTDTGAGLGVPNVNSIQDNVNNIDFGFAGIVVVGLAVLTILIALVINFVRRYFYGKKRLDDWKNSVTFELSVPRETAEQSQKEGTSGGAEFWRSIQSGEQLYSMISEFAEKDWKTWLFGGPRFSLEIVTLKQETRFWLTCDTKHSDLIQRQIVSIYPKAHVVKLKEHDFFDKESTAFAQELTLSNRFELPFKTYKQTENDPLNALTSATSGLSKDEAAAIQLIITPVKNAKWQKGSQLLALKIQQGQNPKEILDPKFDAFGALGKFLKSVFKALKGPDKDDNPLANKDKDRDIDLSGRRQQIQLTPQQQEIIKKLEEKSSRPGFKYTLRIVGSAKTKERAKAIVNNIVPTFQIFAIQPSFNSFKRASTNSDKAVYNFIYRSHNLNPGKLLNTEEVLSIWHLPNYLVQTPTIRWLAARKPPIPLNLPEPAEDTVFLGTSEARGIKRDIYLKVEDRFRHVWSVGGSGSGKTVTMNNIALQDIKKGFGVCVVDPHGESIDDLLRRIPEERIDDVIVFSPAITDRPLALNMLETDPKKPEQKTLVIDTLFSIWDKLYDLKKTGGPIFESYMKNSMRLVMSHPESGSTLMEIPKVLSDDDFRSFKLAMCDEQEVVDFWEKEATKAGGDASLENMVPYITSKLAPFVSNDFLRPMIGQQNSVINFRQAMDNNKIILVSLAKGMIGDSAAYLVGMIILGNILMNGMGRSDGKKYLPDGQIIDINPLQRAPFFVYIDEMQNFLFDAIPKALEEIRKYKIGFYLAHQYVKQVISQGDERIKDSIMANCATKFIFRCSNDDAKYLESEFHPLSPSDIANPESRTFNARILVNGQRTEPFNIGATYNDYFAIENKNHPEYMEAAEEKRKRIIEGVKQKYGRDLETINKEIKDRGKLMF